MGGQPVTIFSSRVDPDRVLELIRSQAPKVELTAEGQGWSQAVATFPQGFLRGSLTLTLSHDPEYYAGPDWPRQLMGMAGYFANFPIPMERRGPLMGTVHSFAFSIGTVSEPEIRSGDDPRWDLLCRIASELSGCLFVPGQLFDGQGRLLIDAEGNADPDAEFPPFDPQIWGDEDEEAEDDGTADEPDPPTAERVAKRALVLAAVAGRGLMEMQVLQGHHQVADHWPQLREWIETLELREECEPDEWQAITTPIGSLPEQTMFDCSWRSEGLTVLAWALGRFELPRYDTSCEMSELFPALGFPQPDPARVVIDNATLRPVDELEELRQRLLAFHWRMRDFSLRPVAMDFVKFGEECWFGPISMDWAEFVERDLSLQGLPIIAAPPEVVGECTSIAMERHQAINWLRGGAELYSATDTST